LNRNDFYEMIFNEHIDIVKRVVKCTIYSDNLADIEDCVQNVLIAALQKQDLQEHPNIEGWLYRTGKNMALQFNREHLQRNKILDVEENMPSEDGFLNQLIEDIELERLKEQGCIKKVLNSLSKTEMQFFKLRYIDNYNNKQISEITRKSEVSVRVRYSRLKEKIEKVIRDM